MSIRRLNFDEFVKDLNSIDNFEELTTIYDAKVGSIHFDNTVYDTEEKIRALWDHYHSPGVRVDGLVEPYEKFRDEILKRNNWTLRE